MSRPITAAILDFFKILLVTHVRKNGTLFFSYLYHILNQNLLLNPFYQAKKANRVFMTNEPTLHR